MIESNLNDRRRELRQRERFPLRVQGNDVDGLFFVEVVLTENISRYGACVTLTREVAVGQRMYIFVNNGWIQNQVAVSIRWVKKYHNGQWFVGLQFDRPLKTLITTTTAN